MREFIHHYFYDLFISAGLGAETAKYLNMLALLIALFLIIFIVDRIVRKILLGTFSKLSERTKTDFDDFLLQHKVPRNLAHIVPLVITYQLYPLVFDDFPVFENYFLILLKIYGIILFVIIVRNILRTFETYFKTLPKLKDKPIDSYVQVVMLFVWIVGIASVLAVLINLSFLKFFTTLGAASAIVLLIFKDTILGFVASIQVAINDSVRIGDWITMEKYGADGDVIEINLSTVQVQNFDKTITHIPTYALISDSFKNWRGMQASGGRRIKRSILLTAKSIKYLTDEHIETLKQIQLIEKYLENMQQKIRAHNSESNIDKSTLINGRNLTNVGVFRKYLQTYIESNSAVNQDMTIMVRQLAPTPQGVPLEIYCFSSDKRWQNYEFIMSDIFDHALAAVPYFDLEIFELTGVLLKGNK